MLGESVDSGASPLVPARYDDIGCSYSMSRREDPRIAAQIHAALGSGGSVVNVGAGTGNYEPADRTVVAVDPSVRMLLQREQRSRLVVRAFVERLPFPDRVFGAALALFTMQHWDDRRAGLRELRRATARSTNNCTAAVALGSPASGSGSANPTILARRRAGQQVAAPQSRGCRDATPSFVQE